MDEVTVVTSDGKAISATKALLMSESLYFQALFHSGMQESLQGTIKLRMVDSDTMFSVMKFLSNGSINITKENIDVLYDAASYLQIPTLINLLETFIIENLSMETVFDSSNLGFRYSSSALKDATNEYLCRHLKEVSRQPEFLNFEWGQIEAILRSDYVEVDTELDLFRIALRWMRGNSEHTKNHYVQLMKCIRLPLIAEKDIISDIQPLSFIRRNVECKKIIQDALDYHENPRLVHKLKVQLRNCEPVIMTVGGMTRSWQASDKVKCAFVEHITGDYLETRSYTFFKNYPQYRAPQCFYEHSACVLDNVLYVAGGQSNYSTDGKYAHAHMYRFDPRFCTWTECSPMQTERCLFTLTAVAGKLYAVGGSNSVHVELKTVECYSPLEDNWQQAAPLEVGVHEHAACDYKGHLYVSGGFGYKNTTLCYKPEDNEWTSKAPMIKERSYHSMLAVEDKIYVLGGCRRCGPRTPEDDNLEDLGCEVYDPLTDQWTSISWIHQKLSCTAAVALDQSIFCFGGYSFFHVKEVNLVQICNTKKLSWSSKSMCRNPVNYYTAVLLWMTNASLKH